MPNESNSMLDELIVYGKPGCKLCEAAKEKLGLLNIPFISVDLENQGYEYRFKGSTDAMARYQETNTLPWIWIQGSIFSYPEAIKWLREQKS